MAGNLSDYLKNELRKHVFRTGSFTKPTGIWLALYTTLPTDAGGGVEVSGGSYARQQIGPSDAAWTAHATPGRTQNAAAVTFPAPTGNWGTVVGLVYFDANAAGNMLIWTPLVSSRVVNNLDPAPSFNASSLDHQWD